MIRKSVRIIKVVSKNVYVDRMPARVGAEKFRWYNVVTSISNINIYNGIAFFPRPIRQKIWSKYVQIYNVFA